MKVDMSPEAVTHRLRTMDELWLLSMKLKDAKKLNRPVTKIPEASPRLREEVVRTLKQPTS